MKLTDPKQTYSILYKELFNQKLHPKNALEQLNRYFGKSKETKNKKPTY